MLGNGKFWSKAMVLAFCCCMQACKGGGNAATQMPPPSQGQSSAELHLISAAPNGGTANGPSFSPTMSDDGRFVAFSSQATNLLSGAVIGVPNANSIYLYDSCQGAGETCAPKRSWQRLQRTEVFLMAHVGLPQSSPSLQILTVATTRLPAWQQIWCHNRPTVTHKFF